MAKRKKNWEFIEDAKGVWGDKFDYSLTEYHSKLVKIKIICPAHGEIVMTPQSHMNSATGCSKCGEALRGKRRVNHPH